jgi:hypothetical protein
MCWAILAAAATADTEGFLGDLEIPAVGLRGIFRRGDVFGTGGGLRTTGGPARFLAFAAVTFAEAFALATAFAFAFPRTDFFARTAAFFFSLFTFSRSFRRGVRRVVTIFVVVVVAVDVLWLLLLLLLLFFDAQPRKPGVAAPDAEFF